MKEKSKISKMIKARFSKRLIEPPEKIDIEEGKEFVITIREFRAPLKRKIPF